MPAQPPSRTREGEGVSASGASLDRGDIVNLLGRLRDRLQEQGDKITVVQNRLIMKRVEAAGITGEHPHGEGVGRTEQQLARIAEIAAEVVPVGAGTLEEELRACLG